MLGAILVTGCATMEQRANWQGGVPSSTIRGNCTVISVPDYGSNGGKSEIIVGKNQEKSCF